jgi:hypothetical protein
MEKEKIIKKGTFLYDHKVICDIQIVETNIRPGTGDPYDSEDLRVDKEGTFYYIKFGSPLKRNLFSSLSLYFTDLQKSIDEADKSTSGVKWKQQ